MTVSTTTARAIQITMHRTTAPRRPLPRVRGRDREGACAQACGANRAAAYPSPSKASSSPNPPAPSPTSRSATASSIKNSATATSPPSTATSSPSNSTRRARSAWWIVSSSGCERRAPRRVAGFAPPRPSPAQLKHHQRREHDGAAERLQRREHLGEKKRAANGREQWLEIHEQRRAERPDAHGRGEHAEQAGGDRGAQPNEGEPAGRGRGRLPVPRRQRDNHEYRRRGEERVPGDTQRIGAGEQPAGDEQDRHPAEGSTERGKDANLRGRRGLRADHQ